MTDRVGTRVAELRKLRGWTQARLAAEAHVSVSLVKKVEQGVSPATPAFIAGTAAVLGVTTSDLTGQPYESSLTSRFGSERAGMPELERAIIEHDSPALDGPLITLEEAAGLLDRAVKNGRASRYSDVLSILPDLIRQLHGLAISVRELVDAERANRLLAQAYQSAMFTAYRLSYLSLAAWCAERMVQAGACSGDPLWRSMGYYCRAQSLMFTGSYRASDAMLARTLNDIEDIHDPRAVDVRGAAHLTAAIIAARLDKRAASDRHIAEASELAVHVRPGDHFDTSFNADNVAIHAVAAAVEMTDGTTALTRSTNVTLQGKLYTSRVGHYHIDLARAYFLHGDRQRTLDQLNEARRVAPQQTRYHPQVRETICTLAEQDRRATESLRNFAAWAGIQS